MQSDDEIILIRGDFATLDVGAKIIDPPQSAALPTSS
jgi:hypothetical protein